MFSGHRDHHLFNAGVYPAPGAGSEHAEQLPVSRQVEGLPSLPQCGEGSVRAREVKLLGGSVVPFLLGKWKTAATHICNIMQYCFEMIDPLQTL